MQLGVRTMRVAVIPWLRFALLVKFSAIGAFASSALGNEVWIVTDRAHPVFGAPADARVTLLDDAQQLIASLSAALPADPSRAAALATERLTQDERALQAELGVAYQSLVDAWSLGITKVPAVVVERRYVLYGESNVERALRHIKQFREVQEK